MPGIDLTTPERLESACREAERLIDPNWVTESAEFLATGSRNLVGETG